MEALKHQAFRSVQSTDLRRTSSRRSDSLAIRCSSTARSSKSDDAGSRSKAYRGFSGVREQPKSSTSQRRVVAEDVVVSNDALTELAEGIRGDAATELIVNKPVTWEDMQQAYHDVSLGYKSAPLDVECSEWITEANIEGEIPTALYGTLLRNGPALFERPDKDGKTVNRAYLDGDGMVTSLAFKDGKCYFRNKFVRTESFTRENEAGSFTDMTIFSPEDPRQPQVYHRLVKDIFQGPPAPKNGANYNVVNWAGSLCAMDWGAPHGLSNELEYEGEREGDDFSQAKFTAHFRIPAEADGSRRMVTFEPKVDWAKGITTCTFQEFDEAGKCQQTRSHVFPATYFHDMIVTENFYVLFDCPVKMDYFKSFVGYPFGMNSLGETIVEDRSKNGVFRIFPRRDNGFEPMVVDATNDTLFAFHHINGYDNIKEDGGKIVFETCTWDRMCLYFNDIIKPDGEERWPRTNISRFVIDVNDKTCTRDVVSEDAYEYPTVAPIATGVQHKMAYVVGVHKQFNHPEKGLVNGPLQNVEKLTYVMEEDGIAVKRIERDVWCPGERKYAMEPLFVPRAGATEEDNGWVVVPVFDAETQTSEVAILDAEKWELVANIRQPAYMPFGVHGSFSDEYVCGPSQ